MTELLQKVYQQFGEIENTIATAIKSGVKPEKEVEGMYNVGGVRIFCTRYDSVPNILLYFKNPYIIELFAGEEARLREERARLAKEIEHLDKKIADLQKEDAK